MIHQLPDEITRSIICMLPGKDIARTAMVCKDMNKVASDIHPWLKKALSNKYPLLDDELSQTPFQFPIFNYKESLKTYEDVEFWSKVCVLTRNRTNGIHFAIKNQLMLREHSLRQQPVNSDITNALTREQHNVVHRPPNKQIMLLQAYAGTGKTTTLYHYAKKWPDTKVLYLAYNRSLAEESRKRFKDLPNVSVMTIHSMALNSLDPEGTRFTSLGNLRWGDIASIVGEETPRLAKQALTSFDVYCSSDQVTESTNASVRKIWNAMFVDQTITTTHDAYLKEFQRSRPKLLEYDVIMLDEVQDCTDCILDLVIRQTHATRIFVGDVYQKIYGFRHVNEPFHYILESNPDCFQLSVSFRMGKTLMHYTNQYLKRMYNANGFSCSYRPADTNILFFNKNDFNNISKVRQLPEGTVVLCRYNSSVHHLMFIISSQYDYNYDMYGKEINFEKEISIVRDLQHIESGSYEMVSRDKLRPFRSVQQVQTHFQETGNFVWVDRIKMFNAHGGAHLISMWTQAHAKKTETNPRIIITTAHRSKGSEFDHVVVYDDFPMNSEDARNTLYVAMTRAKKTLYMNESLLAFYKRASKPVFYTNEPVVSSSYLKTCVLCNTMKTHVLLCSENDQYTIMSKGKCDIMEYLPLCSICQKKV